MNNIRPRSALSSSQTGLTRRGFLRLGGTGMALLASGGASVLVSSCSQPAAPASEPAGADSAFSESESVADLAVALTAGASTASILAGGDTRVWRYAAETLTGDESKVQTLDGSYLGPILHVAQGERLHVDFRNELEEASIIHWHGMIVPQEMDGQPRHAVGAGESFSYEFDIRNRAGTYWFHPHPHGRTGPQVYNGLAGMLIVSDAEEAALGLPDGDHDVALILQDRLFDGENQFVYPVESGGQRGMGNMQHGGMGNMGGMMSQMMGVLGDRILVNGQVDATLTVDRSAYRLRLLNGSNSRIYKLGWSDGTPLTVIGSDGGLLGASLQKPYVTLAPGERVELWADFSAYESGTSLQLQSLAFSGIESGGMMEMNGLPNGAAFPVLTVEIGQDGATAASPASLPEQLSTLERLDADAAINADAPYRVELLMNNMQWTLNGNTFNMETTFETVAAADRMIMGELYLWEFANRPGQGMMADFMAHPMHIHGVQFQVVERSVDAAYQAGWETVRAGSVGEGWKDTVLVMPGETVRVLARFTEPGLFLYHCHNLEHEDAGMMRSFAVMA